MGDDDMRAALAAERDRADRMARLLATFLKDDWDGLESTFTAEDLLLEHHHARAAGQSRCTGVTAQWCPVHGTCACGQRDDGEPTLCDATCPLHSSLSDHAEPEAQR